MSNIIKVKNNIIVNEPVWIETYNRISEMKQIAVKSNDPEQRDKVNYFVEKLTGMAMKVFDTKNYVMLSETEIHKDSLVLLELDYIFTEANLTPISIFAENGELFVECE